MDDCNNAIDTSKNECIVYAIYMHNPSFDWHCPAVYYSSSIRSVPFPSYFSPPKRFGNTSFAHSFLNAPTINTPKNNVHPAYNASEHQHCVRLAIFNDVDEDDAANDSAIKKLYKSVKYTPSTTMKSKNCLLTLSLVHVVRETKAGENTTEQKRTRKSIAICGTVYLSPSSTHSLSSRRRYLPPIGGHFVVLCYRFIGFCFAPCSSNAICFHSSFFRAHCKRNCNKSIKAFRLMHISTQHHARTHRHRHRCYQRHTERIVYFSHFFSFASI